MTAKLRRTPGLRILVTGPDGFIGQHLVRRLKAKGHRLILWRKDVRRPIRLREPVDAVIHLASAIRGSHFKRHTRPALNTNLHGTQNVLEFCMDAMALLIFPSTAGVYGNRKGAVNEKYRPKPLTPYAESKLRAEDLCRKYAKRYGVRTIILRIFNAFGPGQNKEFLIPYLAHCLLHQRPIRLKNPDAERDFIYVDDVVAAFEKALALPNRSLSVFNIGSGKAIAVRNVVGQMLKQVGHAVPWNQRQGTDAEIDSIRADIRKARNVLLWSPRISLSQGLRKTLSATS